MTYCIRTVYLYVPHSRALTPLSVKLDMGSAMGIVEYDEVVSVYMQILF